MENSKIKGTAAIEIDIDSATINNAIQTTISKTIKSYHIESRVQQEVKEKLTRYAKKSIDNGSFYDSLAKNILSQIDLSVIISKINMDELQKKIIERVVEKMINNLSTNMSQKK